MVAIGVELLFIAQKRGFVNSVDCPDCLQIVSDWDLLLKERI